MTREEAINRISLMIKDGEGLLSDNLIEAYKVAIKALEQESTEFEEIDFVQEHKKIPVTLDLTPCDDAISRQAAIEAFKPRGIAKNVWQECHEYRVLSSLPPVNPHPKTGQWIRMSDLSEYEDDRYKCSHCGNVIHHKNKMNLYTFNSWCGRCGSDNRK